MHLLAPLDDLHGALNGGKNGTKHVGEIRVFSTKRACPVCGTSYPELDPRMFSYNSKHGWCNTCVGTGLTLTREQREVYDDTVIVRRRPRPRADDSIGGTGTGRRRRPAVPGLRTARA